MFLCVGFVCLVSLFVFVRFRSFVLVVLCAFVLVVSVGWLVGWLVS